MSREQWGHGYHKGVSDGIKMRMSFPDYVIAMHAAEDSIYGDFAEDIRRDGNFPKTIKGTTYKSYKKLAWDHMTDFCLIHGGHVCREAREAFVELYREWKSAMK